jgi:hypothetical protein
MNKVLKAWSFLLAAVGLLVIFSWFFLPDFVWARNISQYKNTISDSAPGLASNHTFSFRLGTNISPGSYIEITPPAGFEVLGTSTFAAERNVELYVNGVLRDSDVVANVADDGVEIFPGSPGMIRYTLNSSSGISSGSNIELRIGNHTSKALEFSEEYSTTTGTTTTPADIKPIINDLTTGTKKFQMEIFDGNLVAGAGFLISLVDRVGVGPVDTTEEIPPDRFNGAPTSTITGVTLNVELFLETNELAVCRYSTTPDVPFGSMTSTFTGTGLIYHTQVVPVTPDSLQQFYIRCIDDEGNFNIDDYVIEFYVSATPTGESNTEGNVDGDGTGTGNSGTGDGSGGGGETGDSSGEAPAQGGSAGTGGSGGGGGGGGGAGTGSTAGGGFESVDGPYRSGDGRVIMSGFASPRSTIYALVDGKAAGNVRAGNDGSYSITIDKIARGVYTFGVYAIDAAATKSSTFSTSFTVIGARTSSLSNINLPPTVKATPDPVDPGAALTLSGYALPGAAITIENEREGSAGSRQALTATAQADGAWSVTVNTSNFNVGTYKARAKFKTETIETNFSSYTIYGVGQAATRPNNADLNRDGRVNLTDFSILLFWWNTDGGTSDPSADINGDGRVSLTDFSILLFNWTG